MKSDESPYTITLQAFSGPLDLLLHLIEREELDIHQVAIAKVTDQYIVFLQDSLAAQMEVASDFIVMAATLIAIKARSLLPRPIDTTASDEDWDATDDVLDSAEELTQRLVEYRMYKQVALALRAMEVDRCELVGRLPLPLEPFQELAHVATGLQDVDLQRLTDAFQRAWMRAHDEREVEIVRDRETIPQRIQRIIRALNDAPRTFSSLLQSRSRREIVTVFLALLELMRMNKIRCRQEERFGDIWIESNSN